jgi:ABC-type Mn2+/Zn2+ transport system permease subunit
VKVKINLGFLGTSWSLKRIDYIGEKHEGKGGFNMDVGLFIIGIALLLVSYLVGVKKQTWLLAGFNEKMVENKSLLGTIVGLLFFLPLGLLTIILSVVDYANEGTIIVVAMVILFGIVAVLINRKLLNS